MTVNFTGCYFASQGALHAWQPWSLSNDVSRFEAHITLRHRDEARRRLSDAAGAVEHGDPLWIFVGPQDLPRLAGSVVSPEQAPALFDRWRASVPVDRRCGTEELPTVGVVLDVALP